ncbi:GNAT family N-acetyltransferase [Pedobacter cryoconitis]|uniref:RimJ/RimL family protein N-acetyltransferase n=1 Tax=Pedobacter cryoconitis TaxID=188932 RepID=A0A7X0IYP3_9SPHI|nr:GNAT family protein [Pedobacter cryoconitis]MBB6497905.1 RimJ/RimL family protein N-acetyltransferase [Pedobacter cryoconitis]
MGIWIETERLILREYVVSDWEAVHEYAKQEDILIYENWGPNSEADTKEFIENVIKSKKAIPRVSFELAIVFKKEDKLIGGCGFRFDTKEEHKGNLGYIINPLYWRAGYAVEATKALIQYARAELEVKTINATCDVLNIASQAVLKHCGFSRIGLIRKDIEMKGRVRDTFVFSTKA